MRSAENYTIISSPSQRHLIKLRYTKTQCYHCKRCCPYKRIFITPYDEKSFSYEKIIVLETCNLGTLLLCENCVDLYWPEICHDCHQHTYEIDSANSQQL